MSGKREDNEERRAFVLLGSLASLLQLATRVRRAGSDLKGIPGHVGGDAMPLDTTTEIERWENEGGRIVPQSDSEYMAPLDSSTIAESPRLTNPQEEKIVRAN